MARLSLLLLGAVFFLCCADLVLPWNAVWNEQHRKVLGSYKMVVGKTLRLRLYGGRGTKSMDPVQMGSGPVLDMMTDGWWSRQKWIRENCMWINEV
jgi:hypothetical protein